ncbi:PRKC apoptosis WT1 regulator protein [Spea bombifrons]|uniref:PRKC apoptosis WT1 regulator protein n=1 Tax=Spea bombifrons TaxID=233779 RepID=UPI002349659A|nr:PRKC apoptosis WT1 regulator protein [Spea bombifrons]XP_053317996.1 PRKC apoptosis WT1 regulator protein [Spea bombifrons]
MASGGFRSHTPSTSNTTDFLEEWKAKREKMRAKMYAAEAAAAAAAAGGGGGEIINKTSNELNNNTSNNTMASNIQASVSSSVFKTPANRRAEEDQTVAPAVNQQKKVPGPAQDGTTPAGTTQDESPPPTSQDAPAKTKEKAKGSSGPSARKGKGQIEKRKLREKRRSTGVVNIPSAESPDEYDDDEAGQKEQKRENALTQQNTVQNESFNIDPSDSYLQQETIRTVPNRYKSTNTSPDDDATNRCSRSDRSMYNRYSKDTNVSVNSGQGSLEKKIEELERELAKEKQENLKLLKIMQDKEDLIMKMKEEIDLLNRDLDDLEDENKQLKQENKTLLKVVGQLTR